MANDFNGTRPNNAEDEPIPITPGSNQSLLRPQTPKGIAFNKNIIIGFTAVVATICIVAMIFAFSPRKKTAPVDGETIAAKTEEQKTGTTNAALMPQEIAKLSESYEAAQTTGGKSNSAANDTGAKDTFPGTEANPFFDASASSSSPSGVEADSVESVTEQEFEAARRSGIRFEKIQVSHENQANSKAGANSGLTPAAASATDESSAVTGANGQIAASTSDQNQQAEKNAYFQTKRASVFYSASQVEKARSKYEVKASTIIPAVLITGINSDLPGYITAQVRENVYDSTTGRYLLIPQGCRLVGLYDSKLTYAQRRLMIVWTRMIFPDGSSLDLENIPGIDLAGYSGVSGKVNNHWGQIVAGGVITSLLSFGANAATSDDNVLTNSTKEIAGQTVAQTASDIGSKYVEKNLNVQPTIEVKPGTKLNVFVVKDFILKPYSN